MGSADAVVVTIGGNAKPLKDALDAAHQELNKLTSTASSSTGVFDNLGGAASGFGNVLKNVVGGMTSFISNALQIATGMGLYNAFDTLIAKARDFGATMFDLNATMERYQVSWSYLFGTGDNAPSNAIAQQMADWTKIQSYNYPTTRQDMLAAINAAGMATNDPKLIEKYFPDIADITSTRTNALGQPVSMQQAMMSLVQANNGMSRMLKYDLKLNPADLQQYGWTDSGDFGNLLESLSKYNQAHHLTGAAKHIATSTYYGMKSSFEDRIQNFQLDTGNAVFKNVKADLGEFVDWWDANQGKINQIAETLGKKLGDGLKALWGGAKEFIEGWTSHNGGTVFKDLGSIGATQLKAFGDFLGGLQKGFGDTSGAKDLVRLFDSLKTIADNVPAGIIMKNAGDLIGKAAGTGLHALAEILDAIGKISSNKEAQKIIKQITDLYSATAGTGLKFLGDAFKAIHDGIKAFSESTLGQTMLQKLSDLMKEFSKSLGELKVAWDGLLKSLPPEVRKALLDDLKLFGVILAMAPLSLFIGLMVLLTGITKLAAASIHQMTDTMNIMKGTFEQAIKPIEKMTKAFEQALKPLEKLWNLMKKVYGIKEKSQDSTVDNPVGKDHSTILSGSIQKDIGAGPHKRGSKSGTDYTTNMAQGIDDGTAAITAAADKAAQGIADTLGHSLPKRGPMINEMAWMPHFMANLVKGLDDGIPAVAAASQRVAQTIQGSLGSGGIGRSGSNYASSVATNNSYGPANVTINAADEARIDRIIEKTLTGRDTSQNQLRRRPGTLYAMGVL